MKSAGSRASRGRGAPRKKDGEAEGAVSVSPTYLEIYAAVERVPCGCVATYGQVARLAGLPGRARQVGYALHALPPGSPIPWQRVVNARGEISLPGASAERQRRLLRAEGIEFDERGRINLRRFGLPG
jgi:methylated-DNA-protein-cysteine methyltransferase-like protein